MVKYSVLRFNNLKVASDHSIKLGERTLLSLKKPAKPDKLMHLSTASCVFGAKLRITIKTALVYKLFSNPLQSINQSIDQPSSQSVLSEDSLCSRHCGKASRESSQNKGDFLLLPAGLDRQ